VAKQGKRVVRLKGGDPLIFGRASEEIAACREANLSVEVVPGINAAQGAAAKLGLSLTDRRHSRRLQYVTGHARDGKLPTDLDWRSLADPATTTVIYMPTGTLDALVKKGAAEGLDSLTPALAIARATRPDQAVVSGPIGEFGARIEQANLPGPVLVMVGRICEGVDVRPTEELRDNRLHQMFGGHRSLTHGI
jgi:uroporphyrin-III C-methyltransferase/precorrin-2 dehydrogenase/sirohydrochlorin ferrochelatase